MLFLEICFVEDYDLQDSSLFNRPKTILKMFQFFLQIGLIKQPPITNIMEHQNLKCSYLRTMILRLQTY